MAEHNAAKIYKNISPERGVNLQSHSQLSTTPRRPLLNINKTKFYQKYIFYSAIVIESVYKRNEHVSWFYDLYGQQLMGIKFDVFSVIIIKTIVVPERKRAGFRFDAHLGGELFSFPRSNNILR